MSKINVKKETLNKFISLSALKGDIESKELLVKVEEDVITSQAVSPNKVVCFKGTLKGKYANWGEIGIDDLSFFRNFINSLTTPTIELKKKDNKLTIEFENGKMSSVLRNPEYILNKIEDKVYQDLYDKSIGNDFVLKKNDVNKIINYAGTFRASNILVKGEKNKITFEASDESNSISLDFKVENDIKDFSVELSKIFLDILSLLETDVVFSMKTNSVIYIKTEDEDCKFEYILAPVIKSNE